MAVNVKTPVRVKAAAFGGGSFETIFGAEASDQAPGQEVRVADALLPNEIYSPTRTIQVTLFMLEANQAPPTPGTIGQLTFDMVDIQISPATVQFDSGVGNALCTGVSDAIPGLGGLPSRRITFLLKAAPTY